MMEFEKYNKYLKKFNDMLLEDNIAYNEIEIIAYLFWRHIQASVNKALSDEFDAKKKEGGKDEK